MPARSCLLTPLLWLALLAAPSVALAADPAAEAKPNPGAVSYGGIGATVEVRAGQLFVSRIYEEGTAAKAGLKVGDRIYTVDRVPVDGLPVIASIARIRGAAGTNVTLCIEAGDGSGVKLLSILREQRGAK